MRLDGKTAIITGASSGIGRASAVLFAASGANLVLGARRAELLEEVAHQVGAAGSAVRTLAGDVQNADYAKALVDLAEREFGRLEIGFNNAGTLGTLGPIADMPAANVDHVITVNLTSAFHAARYQVSAMRRAGGGSLLFTSSFVGHSNGLPGMSAYGASKAGLVGLVRCLAAELGPEAIRVNALLPGGTATAMNADFGDDPATMDFVRSLHALKRIADPDEIARAALFLASDASSFVTGSAMFADGGNSISKG